jgi:hypothetical protein
MKTKLTLSIDEQVIAEARQLLEEEGKNLSKTFENYLRKRIRRVKQEQPFTKKNGADILPSVAEVAGIFFRPNQDERDYKEILKEELQKEHAKANL